MPDLYLSEPYLQSIRQRIADGEPAIAAAWELHLRGVDEAMAEAPARIGDNGGYRDFRSDVTYISDGVMHPESNRESVLLLKKVSDRTLALALAYRLSGDAHYAERALEWIHRWCIDQDSYMIPDGRVVGPFTPGLRPGGDIGIFVSAADLFLACYLLDGYAGWGLAQRAATKRWVRRMVDAQRELMFYQGSAMYNNWEDARLEFLAKGALFLHDVDLLIEVFDRWRAIIPLKMTDAGELPREAERTRSMRYTLMALNHTFAVAEIAHQCGEDLYGYSVNGRSLKLAIDYVTRHLLDMSQWPHEMIKPLADELKPAPEPCLVLARKHWGDAAYGQVIAKHWPDAQHTGIDALLFG